MTLHKPKIVPFSHLFLIKDSSKIHDHHSYFLNTIQQIVDSIIPESLWLKIKSSLNQEAISAVFYELNRTLPLFKYSSLDDSATFVTLTYLAPAESTQRMRRCVLEMLARVSGKQPEISGGINYNFEFQQCPLLKFFVAQEIIAIRNREELISLRKNLPLLLEELQQKLPYQWTRQADNIVHPIFMPRNEEEMIRNLIDLTKQIKYVRDLPQVSIHYDRQTDTHLSFTVIIARLLKNQLSPLKELLDKSSLKMSIDQTRVMGYLKQRYPKESSILYVTLEKKSFFRADYSVDLLRARQKIVAEITRCLGEFRDFNGGMILKQDESFHSLRQEFEPVSKGLEFTLENYFYSLRPAIMQTVLDSRLLKRHFNLVWKAVKADFNREPCQVWADSSDKFFTCFIAAPTPAFKIEVLSSVAHLKISSRELATCNLEIGNLFLLGFILRTDNSEAGENFESVVKQAAREWGQRNFRPLHLD